MAMREYEFRCEKCNTVWYATKKDLRESKRTKKAIRLAKLNRWGFHTNRTYRRFDEQIAQMQVAYKDFERCTSCGSRQVKKI